MSDTLKVTRLDQTYTRQGQRYGPFSATPEQPFIEVPLGVALASGAPEYVEEGETTPPALSGDVTQALSQGDAVKAATLALESAQQRIDELTGKVFKLVGEREQAQADFEREKGIRLSLEAEVKRLRGELETAQGAASQAAESAKQADEALNGTPLPDDFPMRAKLVEAGFDTVEKVRAGLVKPEGAEKSPVENISGIGGKTAEAIQAALP